MDNQAPDGTEELQSDRYSPWYPKYRGRKWMKAGLPDEGELWLSGQQLSVKKDDSHNGSLAAALEVCNRRNDWRWPGRILCFISDIHADADALLESLAASGGIKKTGPADEDFVLTSAAREMRYLIGGDCFDKGPGILRLLRLLGVLKEKGADIRILAGNHDLRTILGLRSLDLEQDPLHDHFFVRMGPKSVQLLKEVYAEYIGKSSGKLQAPDEKTCRRLMYPPDAWFSDFPLEASERMPAVKIEKEIMRIRRKIKTFEKSCVAAGLSMRKVYAAARKCKQLFVQDDGEFHWFFREMDAAYSEGSFLFVHAGVDDITARVLHDKGVDRLNQMFRENFQRDIFDFYYGPWANMVRTKYRKTDWPLSAAGSELVHRSGCHVIVHGHRNLLHGQRIMLRKGIINFECDATLDRNSRRKSGLKGQGAAVTIIHPQGYIFGISSDHPHIKVFDPERLVQTVARVAGECRA